MSVREIAKAMARCAANFAALPSLIIFALKVQMLGGDRALEGSTQFLSLLPGLWGQYVRRAFLAWTTAGCHTSATVCFGTIFSKRAARIGANAYVGPYCSIGSATIERDVLIATGTHILSGGQIHSTADLSVPIREQPGKVLHVTIGAGSWIGAGAIIMADVGANSVIAAGAVVVKPIPEAVIAAGVPAQVLRSRLTNAVDPPAK